MIYMGYILLINIKNVYKVIEKEEMHVYIHHNFNSVHEDKKNGWKKKMVENIDELKGFY